MGRPSQPLAWRSPDSLAPLLAEQWGHEGLIWLDGDGTDLGRWATLAVDPLEQRCCRGLPEAAGATDPFAALADLDPGHWCGWLSYEAGAWVEPAPHWQSPDMALLWAARHDPVLVIDHETQEQWLEGQDPLRLAAFADQLERLHPMAGAGGTAPTIPPDQWHWHTPPERFATQVAIHHGDKKGKIEIEYYGDDDLSRLLDLLGVSAE